MRFWGRLLGLIPTAAPAGGSAPGAPGPGQDFQRRVEAVLDQVRPALRADGGDIRLVSVSGHSAKVKLLGACQGCNSASLTLQLGIERKLRDEIPGFEDLIPV